MKLSLRILILSALAASSSAIAASKPGALTVRSHDQIPQALIRADLPTAALDRAAARISWPLAPADALAAAPTPFVQQSREFWTDVGESELRAGIKLTTSAKGAVIRLSPYGGENGTVDSTDVIIRQRGHNFQSSEVIGSAAKATTLQSAGLAVAEGTLAFRLADAAPVGAIELAAPNARGRYLVHVFEPLSTQVLTLTADRDTVLVGQRIRFTADLNDAGAGHALKVVGGMVSAPDGFNTDLHFEHQADGSFAADFVAPAAHAVGPALWEVHAFTSSTVNKAQIARDARTAFAVATPSARLDGSATPTLSAQGLDLRIGVEVASASRYQLSGVLYATATDGARLPVAFAQSAAWLEPGHNALSIGVDAATLAASGLKAPYDLRDLRLVNQADMNVIERHEIGAEKFSAD